jgi:hypothetical protein
MAMCSSASRREQIPELEMYLFKRISFGLDAFGVVAFFLKGAFPLAKLLPLALVLLRLESVVFAFLKLLPDDFPFPLLPCCLLMMTKFFAKVIH